MKGIGRFVEIEGPYEKNIRKACKAIGLAYCPIVSTYLELREERFH